MGQVNKLPTLFHKTSFGWLTLPEWAAFHLHLGATLALQQSLTRRLIVGLALPTRAYAAVLIATGLTASCSELPTSSADTDILFTKLSQLDPGTPIIYRKTNNQLLKGIYVGETIRYDERMLCIDVQQGKTLSYLLNKAQAASVEVLGHGQTLPKHQTGRRIVPDEELHFLEEALGPNQARNLIAQSRLDCLLIGPTGQIRYEVKDTLIGVRNSKDILIEGNLNMIVRMRHLRTDRSSYRADLISTSDMSGNTAIYDTPPRVVIFDGAASFLKWRDYWRLSSWVVLLDRTSTLFAEAVQALNNEYISQRLEENPVISHQLLIPGEIEFVSFYSPLH